MARHKCSVYLNYGRGTLRFFYSGLLRRKNALSMIFLSMMSVAVVSFQWFFWGYSLAFSETVHSHFLGNLGASSLSHSKHLTNLRTRSLRPEGSTCAACCWFSPHPGPSFLCVPADVRGNHVCRVPLVFHCFSYAPVITQPNPRHRCCRGTRETWSAPRVCLCLVDGCLRSHCLLDVEPGRVGRPQGWPRFCWRNSRPHFQWNCSPRYLDLFRYVTISRLFYSTAHQLLMCHSNTLL